MSKINHAGSESGECIIIEPVKAPVYELDHLIDAMDPESFPDALDFGRPVGNEVW